MNGKTALSAGAMFLMLCSAGTVRAHHSIGMFDLAAPIWLKATFVGFERVNPHSVITLEETTADGQKLVWQVEGPAAFQLDRWGKELGLNAGDVVEFCAFDLKAEFSSRRPERFVHGHLLVMPKAGQRIWGSYGLLGECMRSRDDVPLEWWMNFINTEDGRNRWCGQQANTSWLSAAAKAFVEESADRINRLMDTPCEPLP